MKKLYFFIFFSILFFNSHLKAEDQSALVTWPLTSEKQQEASISGQLDNANLNLKGLVVNGYGGIDASIVITLEEGTNIPWHTAEDAGKYIEFSITPKNGSTFHANEISFNICGKGGGDMRANLYYSKDETFSQRTQIEYKVNENLNRDLYTLESTPINETIEGNEKIYFRIYPYYKSAASGKYICLKNITIEGTTTGGTVDLPMVSTIAGINSISTESAIVGGSVDNDGGGAVTERGIVWATQPQPTKEQNKIIDGEGVGLFNATLTGLTAGTKYYARAYATNKAGTSYANDVTFTTLQALVSPTVQFISTSSVSNTSLTVNGRVTEWGGTEVTERGVVWSLNDNPTIDDNKIVSGSGLGSFNAGISDLLPETKYNFRVYAFNSTGISYSNNVEVITKATDPDVIKAIAQNGTGDYVTVQEAFDAVPLNYTGKWIIHIKPGTYNERPTLSKGKVNVYLVGKDALTTVITHNTYAGMAKPGGGTWGTSGSQTMAIEADDFIAVNITIQNTYVNSKENAAINANTQAVALKTQGDRQSFYNCRITGYQDTYLGNSIGRAYFKNCYIEGNVDFIFGRQTVIFDHCTTYVNRNGSVLTAPSTEKTTLYGMVFLDCELTAPSTSYIDFDGNTFQSFYYGRPWQQQPKSAFLRCSVPATLHEKGWTTMNGGLNPIFVEYGCTGEGATSDRLTSRGNEGMVLTELESESYTIENIFRKDTDPSFAADWIPRAVPDDILSINSMTEENKEGKSYCFPSPFDDTFNINYSLGAESPITINLYDINGSLVANILNTRQSEGNHTVTVNGTHLRSGIYFCTILSENKKETSKIIKK